MTDHLALHSRLDRAKTRASALTHRLLALRHVTPESVPARDLPIHRAKCDGDRFVLTTEWRSNDLLERHGLGMRDDVPRCPDLNPAVD
jgi:hypothetical protein